MAELTRKRLAARSLRVTQVDGLPAGGRAGRGGAERREPTGVGGGARSFSRGFIGVGLLLLLSIVFGCGKSAAPVETTSDPGFTEVGAAAAVTATPAPTPPGERTITFPAEETMGWIKTRDWDEVGDPDRWHIVAFGRADPWQTRGTSL